MRLPAHEFIHRFLSHVLPQKFVRIRHFGFLGSRQKQKNIEIARNCLGSPRNVEVVKDEDYIKLFQRLVGVDVTKCPCCKTGILTEVTEVLPHRNLRRRRKDTS